ncbi:MAG: tape measure protein [Desulfuromonadaceae bacterium]
MSDQTLKMQFIADVSQATPGMRVIKRDLDALNKVIDSGKVSNDRLSDSFKTLGIQSGLALEKLRNDAVHAYEKIKNSGVASADEIRRAHSGMIQTLSNAQTPLSGIAAQFAKLGPMATAAFAGFSISAVISQLHEAGMAVERLKNSMEVVMSSSRAGAQALGFVRGESLRLGVDLLSASDAFMKLAASAKGTSLEGQATRDIFSAVASAGRAIGMTADGMNGALLAISQMMSKGTVQSEELRGQLGERLPGAFQIAARAMGVSTVELGKMLEAGQVLSEDFLPKFAAELSKTFIPGETALKGMTAETMRLKTAWYELKTTVMENGGESLFTNAITGMKNLVIEADTFYSKMSGAWALLKDFAKNPMNPDLGGKPSPKKYAPVTQTEQSLLLSGATYDGSLGDRMRHPSVVDFGMINSRVTTDFSATINRNSYTAEDAKAEQDRYKATAAEEEKAKKSALAAAKNRLDAITKEDAATAALRAKQQDHLRETAVGLTKEQAAGEKIWTTYNNQLAALDKMNPSYQKNVAIIDEIAATSFDQLKIQTDYQTGLDKEKKSLEDAAEAEKTRLQREQQKLAAMLEQYRINKETAQTQYKTEDMNIGMINDPYAQQQASLEARYERERTLIEEKLALSQQGSALEKAQMEELATLQIKLNHDMTASKKSATAEAWQGVFDSSKKAIPQLAMFDKLIAASQKDYIVKGKDGVVDQTKSNLSMYSSYAGAAGSLFEGLAATQDQTSRKGFESAKAFSMAAAVMSTAQAVMVALASPGTIYTNMAMAAMAAATGVIQIATIASTSFGGTGSVSAPAGSIASVGGGGGNSLANVAIPKIKLEDTVITTREELLASAIDRNSVVVGRLSTSMEGLSGLFKEGGAGMRLATNAPGRFNNTTASSGWLGGDSWRVTGGGMALGITGGQVSASEYTQNSKRGGLFSGSRSSTTYTQNDQLNKYMNSLMTPFITDLKLMANTIGTAFDVTKFNQGMSQLATAGKSEDEIGKAVEAYIKNTLQQMTLTIPGIEKLGGSFDDLYARIIAVNNAFVTANEQLQKIGDNPIDFGKTGDAILAVAVDMENAIASLYGGIEGYNKAMDAYREVMYTQPQRDAQDAANAQRIVNAKWAAIQKETGLVLPDTIAGFNALRTTIDPASPLYHALTMLGPEFAKIKIAAEEATKTTNTWIVREMQAAGKDTTLFELQLTQEEEMRTAAESGLDVQRLRILQDKEWATAVEGVTGTVKKSVTSLSDLQTIALGIIEKKLAVLATKNSIETGPLAQLSPEAAYLKAKSDFEAANGNYDTINAASTAFLEASKGYNASGAAYQTDLQKVLGVLAVMGTPSEADKNDTTASMIQKLQDIKDALNGGNGTDLYSGINDLKDVMQAFSKETARTGAVTSIETANKVIGSYNAQMATNLAAADAGTMSMASYNTASTNLKSTLGVTTATQNAATSSDAYLAMVPKGVLPSVAPITATSAIDYTRYSTMGHTAANTTLAPFNTLWALDRIGWHGANARPAYNLAGIDPDPAATWDDNTQNKVLTAMGNVAQAMSTFMPANDVMTLLKQWQDTIVSKGHVDTKTNAWVVDDTTSTWATSIRPQLISKIDAWYALHGVPTNSRYYPAFATGTPSVPYDMVANIHQGEIIMDRASSDVLRKYGIPTSGSADNKETIAELKETNRLQAEQLKILMAMLTVNQAGLIRVAEATEKTAEATDGMEHQTRLKATA